MWVETKLHAVLQIHKQQHIRISCILAFSHVALSTHNRWRNYAISIKTLQFLWETSLYRDKYSVHTHRKPQSSVYHYNKTKTHVLIKEVEEVFGPKVGPVFNRTRNRLTQIKKKGRVNVGRQQNKVSAVSLERTRQNWLIYIWQMKNVRVRGADKERFAGTCEYCLSWSQNKHELMVTLAHLPSHCCFS